MRITATLLLTAICAHASSALLESRAEGRIPVSGKPDILLFDFRPDSAAGWIISKAVLYLHVAKGSPPEKIRISRIEQPWKPEDTSSTAKSLGKPRDWKVTALPQGWVSVELDPQWLEGHAAGKTFGFAVYQDDASFDGRRPAYVQPYVMVEGDR